MSKEAEINTGVLPSRLGSSDGLMENDRRVELNYAVVSLQGTKIFYEREALWGTMTA
jgi:hypothetical protein